MEIVAAASSIAGLIGLTGQCIAGARNLRDLYQGVASASSTVSNFIGDINSLLQTLQDVQDLLEKFGSHNRTATDAVSLTTLTTQLDICNKDVSGWLATARAMPHASGRGGKAWFRKFWIAVNQGSVQSVRTEMQRRRLELVMALTTLGR